MTILIAGQPDSGKSALAEKTVLELSEPDERIYIACMIPFGEEGAARVERHRRMREGKGFVTIEEPFDICGALEAYARDVLRNAASDTDPQSACIRSDTESLLRSKTVLLECVSNLCANELFERQADPDSAAGRIVDEIIRMAGLVANLIIVSNHFENDGSFDAETALYAQTLDRINERLIPLAGRYISLDAER